MPGTLCTPHFDQEVESPASPRRPFSSLYRDCLQWQVLVLSRAGKENVRHSGLCGRRWAREKGTVMAVEPGAIKFRDRRFSLLCLYKQHFSVLF